MLTFVSDHYIRRSTSWALYRIHLTGKQFFWLSVHLEHVCSECSNSVSFLMNSHTGRSMHILQYLMVTFHLLICNQICNFPKLSIVLYLECYNSFWCFSQSSVYTCFVVFAACLVHHHIPDFPIWISNN